MKRCLLPVILLLAFAASAMAQVTFQWDAYVPATDIDGFKLYQGTATGVYGASAVATITPGTATTFTLPRPSPGIYFWVLRAYKGTLESGNSNEVTATVKPQTPTTLKITAQVTNIQRKQVTIMAQTNLPASMTVTYTGMEGTFAKTVNPTPLLAHQITLGSLRPHSTYNYALKAFDSSGGTASTGGTFTTQ